MSGAMEVPPTPSSATASREDASFIWLLFTTPLSELARGRVTGRRIKPIRASVAPAPLTPSLQLLVNDVAKRTRLWPSEQREIVRELSSHFGEGIDAGRSADELITDFGDPSQAAALLRRAAKRNRPWPWLAMRFALRGVAIVFGLILLVYGLLAARFYFSSTGPIEDFRPKLNAIALNTPDQDKAWPLYREALLLPSASIESVRIDNNLNRLPVPGEPEWSKVEALLAQHADALILARKAAAKPHLGLLVGYNFAPDDAKAMMMSEQTPVGDLKSSDDPGLVGVLLPHLARLRQLGMLLSYDAQRAAAAGDAATALANLNAMLGMVGHMRESPILIGELVGLATFARATETTSALLATNPSLFSDADLTELAHRFAAFDDASLKMRFTGERLFFEDAVQRMFSDDGNGDGRLTPRGLRWIAQISSIWGNDPREVKKSEMLLGLSGPALSAFMLGRRDMAAEFDRVMDMIEADADVPLWERETSRVDELLSKWMDSSTERFRRLPVALLTPVLDKAAINAEFAMMRRDVTLTAIALEVFRRKHGRWPDALTELTPSILPALPIDRFDGQPLRYVVKDGKPMLYSVGTDREDDGGVLPPTMTMDGDRQWNAKFWIPRDKIEEARQVTGPRPDEQYGPAWDGDWILWPPLPQPPLLSTDPEASH